jgi:hypothetical protein
VFLTVRLVLPGNTVSHEPFDHLAELAVFGMAAPGVQSQSNP